MSFSPLWGEWELKELIGKGTFGAVYRAEKTEYGNTYVSAVKHISIPPESMTKEMLVSEGIAADDRTIGIYCDTLRDQIIKEINFCYTLRGNTNIVSYEDHCIIPKKEKAGYDIFIRMELLTPLTKYMMEHPITENDVIRLGISLCEALSVLNINHMIHRDIKPANIFVNSMGIFKLGDFGESKVLSGATMGMSVRGTFAFMSPEISRGESADITADIYSLGLVMYRLLNGNRAPFLALMNQPASAPEMENANVRRLKGEALPRPAYCQNDALSAIVCRACAYRPEERWKTPEAMKQALESLFNRPLDRNNGAFSDGSDAVFKGSALTNTTPNSAEKKKSKLPWIIGGALGAVLLIGLIVTIVVISRSRSDGGDASTGDISAPSYTGLPESSVVLPQSDVPVPSMPESDVPVPSMPESSMPEPSVPVPSMPEPSMPEPSMPEPSVPEPSMPEPSMPEPSVSEPIESSSETSELLSIRDYLSTPLGQAEKDVAVQQIRQTQGVADGSIYTEGEDVIVYEFRYNVTSITEQQKQMMDEALEQNKPDMQAEIRRVMQAYHIRQYSMIYRYTDLEGNVLNEYTISL